MASLAYILYKYTSDNNKDEMIYILEHNRIRENELIPSILVATENVNIEFLELFVKYCFEQYEGFPKDLKLLLYPAIRMGKTKNKNIEEFWKKYFEE